MKAERDFAASLLQRALKAGAAEAEVCMTISKSLSVEGKSGEIDALKTSLSSGYGLRVIKDRRPGFSYSSLQEASDAIILNAVASASKTDQDNFVCLPEPESCAEVSVYDPAVDEVNEERAALYALALEAAAFRADKRIKRIRKASVYFSSSGILIANSRGVETGYRSTACSAQIMLVAEDGGDAQVGSDFISSRFLSEMNFEEPGPKAAQQAVSLLGARKMTARRAPVILDSSVVADFLGVLSGLLSADHVQKGKSLLAGRVGDSIISQYIRIIDDGLLSGRIGSSPSDDEGVPSQRKVLFDGGVLKGYLHNTYTAAKDGTHSTGNASRGGYSSLPSVGITNLYIEPSSDSIVLPRPSFYHETGTGLHVLEAMGVHTANPISGDFSVGVSGIWVEQGEACHPVKEAVISGNILTLFSNIRRVGDDLYFYGGIGCPGLIIDSMDISA